MKRLSELRSFESRGANRTLAFELRSERSGQVLVVTSDEPLVAYQLDDPGYVSWPPGVRNPEGVLIGEIDGERWVVFIELKGTDDPDKGKKGKVRDAAEQLRSMIHHFHPYARSGGEYGEGDAHHDAWRDGEDVLPVMPDRHHQVAGIALFRRVTVQAPAIVELVGGKTVAFVNAPFHGAQRGRLEIPFRRLVGHLAS